MSEDSLTTFLNGVSTPHEIIACDPELADTAQFCAAYGYEPRDSANTIIVLGKADPPVYAVCVVLATSKLDVNGVVRKRLGTRKASFAPAADTERLTGMIIGGVTPFGLPAEMPVWIDSRVMARQQIILGGGGRDRKLLAAPAILTEIATAEVVEDLAKDLETENEDS